MNHKTMGEVISTRRKEAGMTQNDLAEKMGVTDKAVSKWERNLSCPDLGSIPRLAEVLGISLEELLDAGQPQPETVPARGRIGGMVDLVLLAVGLAEGVAVIVTAVMNRADSQSAYFAMLGLGLACLALYLFRQREKQQEKD